ncbi:MAG: DUF1674 domain-containing protein [Magnetospirillum sp.]|nr:MAG: DUF1674 domain-containing protein [Magnetospirillum sp.]
MCLGKQDPIINEIPDTRREEVGGPRGPEPTRFGDGEKGGRRTDFQSVCRLSFPGYCRRRLGIMRGESR